MTSIFIQRAIGWGGLWAVLMGFGYGQSAKSLRPPASQPAVVVSGTVLDPSDAVISGASVILGPGDRGLLQTSTDNNGEFRFDAVVPGHYELRAAYPGFKSQRIRLNVGARAAGPVRIILPIADLEESVRVESPEGRVSAEASENLDVIRLDPRQLEDLPMLDRDVISTLLRFIDPGSTGADGVSVVVDGLPSSERHIPLSEIEEIRINKNPYSAEYARPGRGRIDIITKSGSSKYHGSFYFGFRDYWLDARNAFALERPFQQRRQLEANLSGPIHKGKKNKNTFSLTASHTQETLDPIVYALGLAGPIRENSAQDQTTTYFSGQFTRRMGGNALSVRYSDYDWSFTGRGTGGFVLPEAGSDSALRYHQVYASYRETISPRLLNEFFVRLRREEIGTHSRLAGVPKVVVLDAFTGGGAQVDTAGTDNRFEFTDLLSWTHGHHLLKAGANVPVFGRIGSMDRSNLDGTFYFSSLDDYASRKPFSFMKQTGDGHLGYWQKQVGGFVQDEMKLRPNLSLALGLRYEWQNYGSDYHNLAPRLCIAFAPGKASKTVFRGGAGVFYDSVPQGPIGDTLRLDGNHLRQIQLLDPNYPNPFATALPITSLPPNITRFSPTLNSPYIFQYSFGVERQLRKSLTLTTSYVEERGVKFFRSRDINAPLAPLYDSRPDPSLGLVRQIESSGGFKSHGLDTTLRGDFSRFFTGMIVYDFRNAFNDTDGIGSFPANNWDLRGEWARPTFNTRHYVYIYGTLRAGRLFKFGVLFSANSAHPYSMTTGRDDNRDGLASDRPPGIPRNSLEGTGAATLDMRWSREWPLHPGRKEGLGLETGVDAFNLLNRVNYTSFVGNLSSSFFGLPVSAAPARRMQLSLTVRF
jgi:outer membrane receptor protein involved in Fe transport